jgi:hypothetical protein
LFYEPPSWLPHCTLAMRALDVVAEVISTVADRALPIRGRSSAARLVWLPQRVMSNVMTPGSDTLSGMRPPPPTWTPG